MKATLTLAACLIFFFSHADDRYPRNPNIDIQHYTFRLQLHDSTDVITGEASIAILFKVGIREFDLDLTSVNSGKGMTVSAVMQDNNRLLFTHQHDKLHITLAQPPAAGSQLIITVYYQGIPADGLIIARNKYQDRTFFGDNWPDRAHHWLPVIDHPYEKAGVDFIVTAPAVYEVIGNGIRLEETQLPHQRKLTHWHEVTAIAPKVMVIAAARFAIQHAGDVNGIPVESWVFPQNRAEGFHDYAPAVRVLDFFVGHIGPYSYQKLANVQSKTMFGGMENASNIFYYENSVTGRGEVESLIAHEVAHQWFGNSASENDWHHVWLSEGFATYFTHVYNEYTYGIDRRRADMIKDRQGVLAYYKQDPAPIVNTAITRYLDVLSTNTYQKASWVLHMLRQQMGDSAFMAGVRHYYRKYQNSNAMTDDFRQVMESVSGDNLKAFFNQWIFGGGHPRISGTWKFTGKNLEFQISQDQKEQPFTFPLEIGLYNESGQLYRVETLNLSTKSTKISLPADRKPARIALDPHVNLLFEGDLRNLN